MKDCEEIKEWYDEYRKPKEQNRMQYAKSKLEQKGYSVTEDGSNKCLVIEVKGNKIRFYPYRGWFTGKGIKDGRGIDNLLKQI